MGSLMQVTLAILKPDIAAYPHIVRAVEKIILRNNFLIAKRKRVCWSRDEVELFYSQHEGRFFHGRLVEFMSSGPIEALILAKKNAINDWRKLIGPTKVYKTQFSNPNSLRGKFGLTDTRNAVHGADSDDAVAQEVKFFFPDFDTLKYLDGLSDKDMLYDENLGVHRSAPTIMENVLLQPRVKADSRFKVKLYNEDALSLDLGKPETWSRYYAQKKELVEWFAGYHELKDTIFNLLRRNKSYNTIVDIGCGTSMVAPSLASDLPHSSVYCVDASMECLHQLADSGLPSNCTCVLADICQRLPFEDSSVHLILDKGTMDAVVRHKRGTKKVTSLLAEIMRILQTGGTLLQITTETPETRLDELKSIEGRINISFAQIEATSNDLPIFIYTTIKEL